MPVYLVVVGTARRRRIITKMQAPAPPLADAGQTVEAVGDEVYAAVFADDRLAYEWDRTARRVETVARDTSRDGET